MTYKQIKKDYPEAICLVRVGDFYEVYGEDAAKAADTLGITLTKVGPQQEDNSLGLHKGLPLCGFHRHALDTYLPRLIRAGHRVTICENPLP